MSERTTKCPICGEPYKVYDFFAGDQSACPDCVGKAEMKRINRSNFTVGRPAGVTKKEILGIIKESFLYTPGNPLDDDLADVLATTLHTRLSGSNTDKGGGG